MKKPTARALRDRALRQLMPERAVWAGMMARCYYKKHDAYQNYGGRGIKVYRRWHKFANFLADMGPRLPGMTIERKNSNRGYTPWNCVWVPLTDQPKNRRTRKGYTYNGIRRSLPEWAIALGMPLTALKARVINYGWPIERALTTPLRKVNWKRPLRQTLATEEDQFLPPGWLALVLTTPEESSRSIFKSRRLVKNLQLKRYVICMSPGVRLLKRRPNGVRWRSSDAGSICIRTKADWKRVKRNRKAWLITPDVYEGNDGGLEQPEISNEPGMRNSTSEAGSKHFSE